MVVIETYRVTWTACDLWHWLSRHQFDTNMPVHRDQEKKESTAADMEVEEHEHEASTTEEEDSDTTSISEDGESSGEEPPRGWKLSTAV